MSTKEREVSQEGIDCVVVGYNDTSFDVLLGKTKAYSEVSGGYRHLLANSVEFSGRRLKYADLLNHCIEVGTGVPSRRNVSQLPNLGACHLVSYLRRRGFVAELINFFNFELKRFADLLAEKVAVVAITTTYYFEPEPIQEVIRFIREHNPSAKIVVGGPHIYNVCTDTAANLAAQKTLLAEMGADIYVFDSQGEHTLSQICAELKALKPELTNIPNLIFTTDGWRTMQRTTRKIEANSMNSDAVDWSDFPRQLIVPAVQTRTARSCAFKCAFCRYPVMAGELNLTDLDVVEKELDYLRAVGVRYVLFIDDTFNIPEPRFKKLCRLMIENRYEFQWFSYFRCANADDECFELMARAGCKGVFLGIESGNADVLKAMRKAATPEKYLYGIRRLNELGIITYASFIVGHPGETKDTAESTFEFIEQAKPTFYCLESFFFDPKTPIAAKAAEFNLKGGGYRWQHMGMDWRQSAELVETGYRSIAGSTICPLYSFDLWSFAYLLGTGIGEEKLKSFLTHASELLVSGFDTKVGTTRESEGKLEAMFADSLI